MNFSYSKYFFTKTFPKGFTNNKFSSKIFNNSMNSTRCFINFSNRFYNTRLTILNRCTSLKTSIFSPNMFIGSQLTRTEIINQEDGGISFIYGPESIYLNECMFIEAVSTTCHISDVWCRVIN